MRPVVRYLLVSAAVALAAFAPAAAGEIERVTELTVHGAAKIVNRFVGKPATTITRIDGEILEIVNADQQTSRFIHLPETSETDGSIYDANHKKKTYELKTLEELRAELTQTAEAFGAFRVNPQQTEAGGGGEAPPEPTHEVEFEIRSDETPRDVNGFQCTHTDVVITVKPNEANQDGGGGSVITASLDIASRLDVEKQIADFHLDFKNRLGMFGGLDSQQLMKTVLSSPPVKDGWDALEKHRRELDGTVIRQVVTIESIGGGSQGGVEKQPSAKKMFRGLRNKLKRKKDTAEADPATDDPGAARKKVATFKSDITRADGKKVSLRVPPDGYKQKG